VRGSRSAGALLTLGGITLATASPAPTVSVSELAHCAAIVAVDQRLACYDSLAVSKLQPAATPAAAKPAPAAAAASGTAAAATAAAAGGFGMSTHTVPTEQATQLVTAHIVSGSGDRQGNVYVVLDNGQSWTYPDAGGPPQPGGEVTIRRASLGSYLLTTPSHHTYRAQRTQ
jgi:hypothetical protein